MKVKPKKTLITGNKVLSIGVFLLLPAFANANFLPFNPLTNQVNQPLHNMHVTVQKAYVYYGRHWHRPLWVGHTYDEGNFYTADEPESYSFDDEGAYHRTSDEPGYYGFGYNHWNWVTGHWVHRPYFGWRWVPGHWERP